MKNTTVRLNNLLVKARRSRAEPAEILLLLPSCLQHSECGEAVRVDPQNCKRCGRCPVKDLVEMADELGIQVAIATGGRVALKRARSKDVRVIVAVACPKELRQAIRAAFPKAVIGVANSWPNGPCKDTQVEVQKVREAVEWFLR